MVNNLPLLPNEMHTLDLNFYFSLDSYIYIIYIYLKCPNFDLAFALKPHPHSQFYCKQLPNVAGTFTVFVTTYANTKHHQVTPNYSASA